MYVGFVCGMWGIRAHDISRAVEAVAEHGFEELKCHQHVVVPREAFYQTQ